MLLNHPNPQAHPHPTYRLKVHTAAPIGMKGQKGGPWAGDVILGARLPPPQPRQAPQGRPRTEGGAGAFILVLLETKQTHRSAHCSAHGDRHTGVLIGGLNGRRGGDTAETREDQRGAASSNLRHCEGVML